MRNNAQNQELEMRTSKRVLTLPEEPHMEAEGAAEGSPA
jgi:hypothetical protein